MQGRQSNPAPAFAINLAERSFNINNMYDEWIFMEIENLGCSIRCLCNHPLRKKAWVFFNPLTGNIIKLGPKCKNLSEYRQYVFDIENENEYIKKQNI